MDGRVNHNAFWDIVFCAVVVTTCRFNLNFLTTLNNCRELRLIIFMKSNSRKHKWINVIFVSIRRDVKSLVHWI